MPQKLLASYKYITNPLWLVQKFVAIRWLNAVLRRFQILLSALSTYTLVIVFLFIVKFVCRCITAVAVSLEIKGIGDFDEKNPVGKCLKQFFTSATL